MILKKCHNIYTDGNNNTAKKDYEFPFLDEPSCDIQKDDFMFMKNIYISHVKNDKTWCTFHFKLK